MRWRTTGLCALSLVGLTGCPEDFEIGGRIDQAVHKDVMERVRQPCSYEDYEKYCEGAKKNTEECREACGE